MRLPTAPFLRNFRVINFKAIRDSGNVRLTPLTVFIGNNGVGKSSLVEALETLQILVIDGVDEAMNRWKGIEHVTNKAAKAPPGTTAPVSIALQGKLASRALAQGVTIGTGEIRASSYTAFAADRSFARTRIVKEWFQIQGKGRTEVRHMPYSTRSALDSPGALGGSIRSWQFLQLNPEAMGILQAPMSGRYGVALKKDASNIAAYLKSIYDADIGAFEGLVDAMRYVVPYAQSFDQRQTGDLVRNDYITLSESGFTIPGWMISTGTLRVLAILACLRHPDPPQLLVVEEIENGLDPRTLSLVINEIMSATESGRTQVILTTHSPTLLDQVPLECIVTVERHNGQPVFHRPIDDEGLAEWRKEFLPGQLYTMGRFRRNKR